MGCVSTMDREQRYRQAGAFSALRTAGLALDPPPWVTSVLSLDLSHPSTTPLPQGCGG